MVRRGRRKGFASARSRAGLCAATAALLAGMATPAQETPPHASHDEEVEVRIVQVDVSVLAPGQKGNASVPGLGLEHFDLRIDGRRLDADQLDAVRFDPLCDVDAVERAPEERSIIALVDFNYLDARARMRVALAIDALAERAGGAPERYKILGLTRQIRRLTEGFTRDPEELHRAAELVRGTAWRGGTFVPADGEGVPQVEDVTLRDEVEDLGPLPIQLFSTDAEAASAEITLSEQEFEARQSYTPEASIAAIEAVLRGHSGLPGSKALILFSSESFRVLRTERFDQITQGIRELIKLGFRVWTVDVEGISREQSGASELLSLLAHDSGGRSVRRTGELIRAFDGVSEQLSCHYLFSLPVKTRSDRSEKHLLTVKIDTDRYPEMWNYRVIAPSQVTLADKTTVERDRRVAALLAPLEFDDLPVDVTLAYPIAGGVEKVLPVQVRVPLAGLTWLPDGERGSRARVALDVVVQRESELGIEPVCSIGAEKTGVLELRLPRPPSRGTAAGLTVRLPCPYRKDGLYVARAVATDIESRSLGGGRSTALIRSKGEKRWRVHEARIQAASGLDLIWLPGEKSARRDRARVAWRAVRDDEKLAQDDRVALRFVLCGPDARTVASEVKQYLLRRADGSYRLMQTFGKSALSLAPVDSESEFCASALVAIPAYSLEPGDYAILVTRGVWDGEEDSLSAEDGAGVLLVRKSFSVR